MIAFLKILGGMSEDQEQRRRHVAFYHLPKHAWQASDWQDAQQAEQDDTELWRAFQAGDLKTFRDEGTHVVPPIIRARLTG
jgi:hypothetical protein